MNLDKIETLLCFAFQSGDIFNIKIEFEGGVEYCRLSKEEIKICSNSEWCKFISISEPKKERRWRQR